MSFTFQANTNRGCPGGIAFCKSLNQARNVTNGTISAAISVAVYPLWGFGNFVSWSPTSAGITFNNTAWPFVYRTLTETTTQTDGQFTGTRVTTYNNTVDTQTTVTTTGQFAINANTVLTQNVTPNSITATYITGIPSVQGTYTAHLSGTVLDNTLPGPFNPATDWEALTAKCMALLDLCPLPALKSGSTSNWIQPLSLSLSASGYGIAGAQANPICAAARGLPMYGLITNVFGADFNPPLIGNSGCQNIAVQEPFGATNCDYINPFNSIVNPPTNYGNFGAVVCVKSLWSLTGKGPQVSNNNLNWPSRLSPAVTSNSHLKIYKQPWTPNGSAPGFTPSAPGAVLKTFTPSTQSFDAKTYFSSNQYGVLGFLPIAS